MSCLKAWPTLCEDMEKHKSHCVQYSPRTGVKRERTSLLSGLSGFITKMSWLCSPSLGKGLHWEWALHYGSSCSGHYSLKALRKKKCLACKAGLRYKIRCFKTFELAPINCSWASNCLQSSAVLVQHSYCKS